MRQWLGVWAGVVALCMMSWAQAPPSPQTQPGSAPPDQTPPPAASSTQAPASPTEASPQETSSIPTTKARGPKYPRLELFGGYSFAQAGFFNSGHWAQLNGWNTSFGLNVTRWIGVLVDASEFFGNSQIPTSVPAPFPPCQVGCPSGPTFNVDTREYNILFGGQFTYRKRERWTPFAELMFGHDGVRGQTYQNNLTESAVGSGLALVAGAGADHRINDRFALRFKADYLQTRTAFPISGRLKQENLRLSVGIVIRNARKKRRTLEEETDVGP